jgi:hypothetical protein
MNFILLSNKNFYQYKLIEIKIKKMNSNVHHIMQEQDEKIDVIGKSVKNIKQNTNLIGDEIDKQGV